MDRKQLGISVRCDDRQTA